MQPNAKILKVMIYLTTFQVETSSKSKYKIKMAVFDIQLGLSLKRQKTQF